MINKKKIIAFLLTFAIVLTFGQTSGVQALTSNSNNTSDSVPNPGVPESKPSPLNITSQYNINNNEDSKVNITSTIGWKYINGYWYYYKSDNSRAIGWIKPDNNWYYLKDDGKMATGWIYSSGQWYYLNKAGNMAKSWKCLDGVWYFFGNSGSMITGLNEIDNTTYMFYNNGYMATGWIKLNNNWYHFNNNGNMDSGWITDGGAMYYLYDTGAMAKGWINLSGTWYYLKDSGAMAIGWVTSGNDTYYLDSPTGRMLTDATIGGYKIGSNGKRISTIDSTNSNGAVSNNNSGTTVSYSYRGIDISHYNGDINFSQVKASGIQCVYIKATEGTTYVDNYLGTYYNGAHNAGLKTGFYHFLVGTSSPETQAQNFYNNIKDKQSDLKPALDIETDGFEVMDYAVRFIAEFKRLSNMDVCIYTYSDFIGNLDSRLSKYTLWEANYSKSSSNLPSNNIWSASAGHQYTDSGVINGINGNVDLDNFSKDIFR